MHVWTMGSAGAPLRQLTRGTGDEDAPTWSADGRFIYFAANRGQGYDIWRVPSGGGSEERITTDGSGAIAFESPDGRSVLYQQKMTPSALLLKPSAGGAATVLVPCAEAGLFTWHRTGIYYVPCGSGPDAPVNRRLPGLGNDARVFTLERLDRFNQGDLAVSFDGRTVLYASSVNEVRGGDLWMIDPFK
jgi:dipeptidyl aminopeptidase/acylaminoacyl peptidase